MKKYIDQILGDNLRCILPSFWWKKLLYKMADRISYAETAASSASSTVSTVVSSISSAIGDKQDKLYSGSNIKTINGQSILGSGNLEISGESGDLEERVSNIEEFFEEGAKLNLTIKSNQDNDDIISAVKAKITYDGGGEYAGSGVVGLPVFTDITITFPDVDGYRTPEPIVFTTGALPTSYTVTYETEVVTVNVFTWDGSAINTNPLIVINYGEYESSYTWNGNVIQKKIPFGDEVKVSIEYVEGYVTPVPVTFIASKKNRLVNLLYSEMVGSWIMIDQNISDPSTMISGDINGEHIQLIRKNSHRYVGKCTEEGTVTICQLDDSNSNYYKDGGNAILTGEEGDVFMKLPKFWYNVVNVRTDVFSIGFYCGEDAPSGGWKAWEGDELIGVYMATKRSGKTMSVSGIVSELIGEDINVPEYNGTGFSQIKWKHHNIMATLYCAMYGNTNSQEILGYGHTVVDRLPSGQTNELGMSDSVNENGEANVVNFWGLENWWGDLGQALCNTDIGNDWVNSSAAGGLEIEITEDDGTNRTMILKRIGYATKFVLGEHLDMFPTEFNGSATTGYCDYCGDGGNALRYIYVGKAKPNINGAHGIFCFGFHANGYYNDNIGSRLAFKGNIIIENNSATFKSLTTIN